ncbi:Retinoblastoma- protein 1 [Nowakowskiella sp. JEL0078]|nr:Retinoblastoma- protein 1 [Nowakowskiella sp. JEL0078]
MGPSETDHMQGRFIINVIGKKIDILSRRRLNYLLDCLQQNILETASFKALELFLNDHSHRILLNRHLDSFIICSVYAAASLADTKLTFATIVAAYKTMPHYIDEVFTSIHIAIDTRVTIPEFYNKIFLPFFRNARRNKPGATPRRPYTSLPHGATPSKLGVMTPMTRKLYSTENDFLEAVVSVATSKRLAFPAQLRPSQSSPNLSFRDNRTPLEASGVQKF